MQIQYGALDLHKLKGYFPKPKKTARRNSSHHFFVLFFIRLEFYDVIQFTVKKLAKRI